MGYSVNRENRINGTECLLPRRPIKRLPVYWNLGITVLVYLLVWVYCLN